MQTVMQRIDAVLDARNSGAITPSQMALVIENILRKEAEGNPPETPRLLVHELDLSAEQHDS